MLGFFFAADQPSLATSISNVRPTLPGGTKLPGSITVYFEPWHLHISGLLDLHNDYHEEHDRVRNVVLLIPDLLVEGPSFSRPTPWG